MVKYAGPIIIACLYLLFSAWLVGSVGKAHRQSLQEARKLQSRPPLVASERRTPEGQGEPRTQPIENKTPPAQAKTIGPAPIAESLSSHSSPREPGKPAASPSIAVVEPTVKEPTAAALAKEAVAKAGPLKLGSIDPFFDTIAATKKWDFNNWNVNKESDLGSELNAMVLRFNRKSTDGALERRVLDAADPILEARTRKDLKYDFFVLDSDAINAFSHPGGYVYVTRGLLNWISEDENEALQFALAHEIFHVDCGHALVCLQDANVRKLPFGTLTIFYLLFFPRAYPDAMEFAADDWALKQLRRLGCT